MWHPFPVRWRGGKEGRVEEVEKKWRRTREWREGGRNRMRRREERMNE